MIAVWKVLDIFFGADQATVEYIIQEKLSGAYCDSYGNLQVHGAQMTMKPRYQYQIKS